jgi:hypothetical protein
MTGELRVGAEVHRYFIDDASLERPFRWVVISLYDTARGRAMAALLQATGLYISKSESVGK